MKKTYSTPITDISLLSQESGVCVTASMSENEGFIPVPGVWDTPTI